MQITKLKTVTAEEIVAQLSDAVHEHRLKPGVKLREDEVSEVFGVSRTIVRQALRNMAFGGLLTI
ncbi:MAG: GntR family transcriptional regulator, partial [Rhodobacteraceae bacterium]|nr:GntR family transcriptional regulator [Paracoccaceae bacterium]